MWYKVYNIYKTIKKYSSDGMVDKLLPLSALKMGNCLQAS